MMNQLEDLTRLHFPDSYWFNKPSPELITGFYFIKT